MSSVIGSAYQLCARRHHGQCRHHAYRRSHETGRKIHPPATENLPASGVADRYRNLRNVLRCLGAIWRGLARFGDDADNIRLLYGGSVKPTNAAEIFQAENVDGALVGGASLKATDFQPIIDALAAS